MIPNYKRPMICEYLWDILERPMTDEDLDMLNYLEGLEQEVKELKAYLQSEEKRLEKLLHEFGNKPRNEYSGLLLGKCELIRNINRLIEECEMERMSLNNRKKVNNE